VAAHEGPPRKAAAARAAAAAAPKTTRQKKPQKEKKMPVGIGLSGSGFLIFFLLGALAGLEEGGSIKRGPNVPLDQLTPFAGASGGSILTIASCLGIPYNTVYRESSRLADYCAGHNDCSFSLDSELRRTLQSALSGVHDGGAVSSAVARCRNRAFVNLSLFAASKTAALDDTHPDNPFNSLRGVARRPKSRNETDPRRRSNNNALSEIGLELRPGASLCDAMGFQPLPRLALLKTTQALFPPGLGLHPTPWLVSDWRSAQDVIDAVAASSYNVFLSGISPTTSFRGRPIIADGIYTVPLPVPPVEVAARSIRIASVPDGVALAPGSPPIVGADISPGKRTGNGDGLLAGLTVEEWICHALVVADSSTRRRMYELGRREAELFLREEEANGR
jgi:hypothetical protein